MDGWLIPKQVSTPFVLHQPCLISLFSRRIIRYIMTYIVDLTVILHGLFLTTRRVSAADVQSAVRDYGSTSGSQIHEDIRSFVEQTPLTNKGRDMIMEKIIDLIEQNCELTS
jgi:hypothetical protein